MHIKLQSLTPVMWIVLGLHILVYQEVLSVAVTQIRLLSDSNKSEYVLHGEGATLTCHYVLGPNERLSSVRWAKDGRDVYVWTWNQPPLAMGVFEGRVDTNNKSPSTIYINKVHMEMHGLYTCKVQANGRIAENDFFLTVIVDSCQEDTWVTHSDMVHCTEYVSMKCFGMFPKPSPACGIYNEQTGNYLNSVPFDRVVQYGNGTYHILFNRWYTIHDFLNYTDVSFRCYVIVLGTNWRRGIRHKLFGDPGCLTDPPAIENGYYNVSEGTSCWGTPREGSTASYNCLPGYTMKGPAVFRCKNGTWMPEAKVSEWITPQCSNAPVPCCIASAVVGFAIFCLLTT